MDSETICITGGAGFIGSHLADAFLAAGHRVVVIDDLSTGRKEHLDAAVEFHQLDIRGAEASEVVAQTGIDILVHQAAQIDVRRSVADPVTDADINVSGSLRLFEAARRGGVRQILFASTGGAIYGEQERFPADESHPVRPLSPYGVSKLAIERYLYFYHFQYGLDVTCLRYANVYGERQNPHGEAGVVAIFLDLLLSDRQPTINGDGGQTRDFVHVSDIVKCNLAALNRPGFDIFNVGTGLETSVTALYQGLAKAAGSTMPPKFGPAKGGEQRRSSIDPSRIERQLGTGPALPLAEGLQRTADWFRRRHVAT